ncbi:hypothetical protein EVA_20830 [gut metagenome]|uniref:Uncharacterized protein n=1 Tax=gut metagenome TaxID=749906 RepID=J9F854_9ZZZZ
MGLRPVSVDCTMGELLQITVEAAVFCTKLEKNTGIGDGGLNLEPVAHNAWVSQEGGTLGSIITSYALIIEIVESSTEGGALVENALPRQTSLKTF